MKTVSLEEVATEGVAGELGLPPRVQEALGELMEEEVDEVAGPKGRHNPERAAVRHGHERGEVTLGGRRVQVERPRVRSADGESEMPPRTYRHFADRDPFSRHASE